MISFCAVFQRDEMLPIETRMLQLSRVVGEVAPSMLLTAISESAAFLLGKGTLSSMFFFL